MGSGLDIVVARQMDGLFSMLRGNEIVLYLEIENTK